MGYSWAGDPREDPAARRPCGILVRMGIVERDYILRVIEQLAQAVAKVMGLVAAGKLEEALAQIDQSEQELLGSELRGLRHVDGAIVAVVLHSPDRVRGWALLTAKRAHVLELMARHGEARIAASRAMDLYAVAQRRGAAFSELDHTAREQISALLAQ